MSPNSLRPLVHSPYLWLSLLSPPSTFLRGKVMMGRAHNEGTHCYTGHISYKRSKSVLLLLLFLFPLISFLAIIGCFSPFPFPSDFFLSYSSPGPEMAAYSSPSPSSISNGTSYVRALTPAESGLILSTKNSTENRIGKRPFSNSTENKDKTSSSTSTNSTHIISSTTAAMYCDRSHIRTDICFMKGDIRTHSSSNSIHLYTTNNMMVAEKIKPYTRKWETSIMDTIPELTLIQNPPADTPKHRCDVHHDVPAVIFSTSGYTGNLYHEFNDGLIPLYITSQHLNRKVVFLIINYHQWWYTKYGDVLSQLSDYPPINFDSDKRTHCFPEAIVGLRIHDELTVDPSLMNGNKSTKDFHNLLDQAYRPRIKILTKKPPNNSNNHKKKPTLVLLSRTGSRAITNEGAMVSLAKKTGFEVRVIRPVRSMELAKIYKTLNESDVLVAVHGAAMTHLLFMRPGSVLIQIVPIGTEWPANRFYEDPAVKMGLQYMKYSILPKESSLLGQYKEDDPVIKDPNSVGVKGWEFTKKIYLDNQTIKLDVRRFRKVLVDAYRYVSSR